MPSGELLPILEISPLAITNAGFGLSFCKFFYQITPEPCRIGVITVHQRKCIRNMQVGDVNKS